MKLKLSPEKTRIVNARKKGVEYLGFHFNGRWRRPTEKAVKKFKAEIKHRTRRQQPKNLENVIASINPIIRGWGYYFKEGTVAKLSCQKTKLENYSVHFSET